MTKSSGDDIPKFYYSYITKKLSVTTDQMTDTTQSRDDDDALDEEDAKNVVSKTAAEYPELEKQEGRDAGEKGEENQQLLDAVQDMKAPATLSRSRSAMPQLGTSNNKSSPQDMAAPTALSRGRSAMPKTSTDKFVPTFQDMMALVALSRTKSLALNRSSKVAEPEAIVEVQQ